jgi:hypothetical protein
MNEMNDLNTHPWVVTQEGFDDCLTWQGGGLCSSLYTLCRVSDNLLGGDCVPVCPTHARLINKFIAARLVKLILNK